ncbi:MAG: hypothetical protein ACI4Q4_02935, partial [Oscillospiraceae bacterium]
MRKFSKQTITWLLLAGLIQSSTGISALAEEIPAEPPAITADSTSDQESSGTAETVEITETSESAETAATSETTEIADTAESAESAETQETDITEDITADDTLDADDEIVSNITSN